ncbi:hypothetical protein HispidOSU_014697 [Sigmodon hispidus]
MGSQRSQVRQGVPRGSSAELVVTHKAWEPGAEGRARVTPGKRKGGAPSQPVCPPPWVTGPPREFKVANENGELASERGVNAGGGHASARLSFARGSATEQRAAAPRTCFVQFVQMQRARFTPSNNSRLSILPHV